MTVKTIYKESYITFSNLNLANGMYSKLYQILTETKFIKFEHLKEKLKFFFKSLCTY